MAKVALVRKDAPKVSGSVFNEDEARTVAAIQNGEELPWEQAESLNEAKDEPKAEAKGVDITPLTEALTQVKDNMAEAAGKPEAEEDVEIKIDTDIPMPETKRERKAKYPWASLQPGQSFFVPNAKVETFYTLCSGASKKYGCKFIARKWDGEKGVQGVRVWRTKD